MTSRPTGGTAENKKSWSPSLRFRVKLAIHGYLTRLKASKLFTLSALTGLCVYRGSKGYEKQAINVKRER